jgi:hypothetical protein
MPTSPDGILEALFDPSRAAVVLTVDGGMWPDPVTKITMWRTPLGQPTVEVRGLVQRRVEGGWWIGNDHEAPLDVDVTYRVTGYDSLGDEVATAAVTVSTTGAAWGLWLKAPGRGDLTCLVRWRGRGAVESSTIGAAFQVHSGPEIAAWSGVAADRATIDLTTRTPAQDAAVARLLTTARVLLIQTGQPAEIGDGTGSDWWLVESASQSNPTGMRSDLLALRHRTLQLVRTTMPAGQGVVSTGQTYSSVSAAYATYQDILDEVATYGDLMTGGS